MSRIAEEQGKYTNFSGIIKNDNMDCVVENATFEILETGYSFKNSIDIFLIFDKGKITDGWLRNALINNGTIGVQMLSDSVFRGGKFVGNEFSYSYWYDGIWQGKTWHNGFDKFGRRRGFPPTEWGRINRTNSGVANKVGFYENFSGRIK